MNNKPRRPAGPSRRASHLLLAASALGASALLTALSSVGCTPEQSGGGSAQGQQPSFGQRLVSMMMPQQSQPGQSAAVGDAGEEAGGGDAEGGATASVDVDHEGDASGFLAEVQGESPGQVVNHPVYGDIFVPEQKTISEDPSLPPPAADPDPAPAPQATDIPPDVAPPQPGQPAPTPSAQPAPVQQGQWQPYTNGQWVQTQQGPTWQSSDPGGDITCHYGRWAYDPSYGGWFWVPGTVWAPSYVAWRGGDVYSGWAPLPPEGTSVTVIDAIPADRYVFVRNTYLTRRIDYRYVEAVDRRVTIINRTTNITRIVNNRVDYHYTMTQLQPRLPANAAFQRVPMRVAHSPAEAAQLRRQGAVAIPPQKPQPGTPAAMAARTRGAYGAQLTPQQVATVQTRHPGFATAGGNRAAGGPPNGSRNLVGQGGRPQGMAGQAQRRPVPQGAAEPGKPPKKNKQ